MLAVTPPIAGIVGGVLKTYSLGSTDFGSAVFLGFFVGILVTVACLFVPWILLLCQAKGYLRREKRIVDVIYYSEFVLSPVLAFIVMYCFVIG